MKSKFNEHYRDYVDPKGNKYTLYDMATYYGTVKKRNLNGEDQIVDQSAILNYDIVSDNFFYHNKGYTYLYNYYIDYKKLSEEEKEEYLRQIEEASIPYQIPNSDGKLYVDIASLKLDYHCQASHINAFEEYIPELNLFPLTESSKKKGRK